jgi:hypothetical protein
MCHFILLRFKMTKIDRLKQLEKEIKDLKKIIEDERYYGAGLTLDIYIGNKSQYFEDRPKDCDFIEDIGIANYDRIETILKSLLISLEESFEFSKKLLKNDIDEAISCGYYKVE